MKSTVQYTVSRTLNLGEFESVKVQIGLAVEVEGGKTKVDKAYTEIKRWVDEKLEEEVCKWQI